MSQRALLIGSETYGLLGCNADVALMREVLTARGFDAIDVRTDAGATRAGILDGFEQLIAAVAPGDAVVVYYSGHGGRVARPDFDARKAAGLSVHFQFIVPTDMAESEAGDFRGLLSEELTVLQGRLTDTFRHQGEVPNVTTILDCCHSGYMARDTMARAKSIELTPKMFRMRGIREHLEELGPQVALAGLATNPDAVRIVACQPEQSAFELPSTRGGRHGALTDALASVLGGLCEAPVPWAVVGDLVRRRVRALVPEQRPEVEGPGDRLVFSAASAPARTAIPVTKLLGPPGDPGADRLGIEAAALLGIGVGDEFELLAPGRSGPIGTASVTAIEGGTAVLHLSAATGAATGAGAGAALDDVIAVPTRISVPKVPIHVGWTGVGADSLTAQIDASSRVGVGADASTSLATVTQVHDGLAVVDRVGARWRTDAFTDDESGHRDVIDVVEALAVGHRLLDLASGEGASALPTAVVIEFGVVEGGVKRPIATHGERLTAGARVFLTVHNTGAEPLFCWIFDVGVSGRSSLLSNAAPSGTMIGAAGAEDDTLDVWGAQGSALFWPVDVPTTPAPADGAGASDAARPETFVVLLADRRSDLGALASSPGTARGMPRSPLDAIMDEARTGVREAAPVIAGEPPLRYRLEPIDFLLLPS